VDGEEVDVKVTQSGKTTQARFHRVKVPQGDSIAVEAEAEPTAVWVPAGSTVVIIPSTEVVIDVSEVVQHEDVVSMDKKLREMRRLQRQAEKDQRRAKRRLRRGERPVDGDKPKDDYGPGNRP
jgi:hypothetical protein